MYFRFSNLHTRNYKQYNNKTSSTATKRSRHAKNCDTQHVEIMRFKNIAACLWPKFPEACSASKVSTVFATIIIVSRQVGGKSNFWKNLKEKILLFHAIFCKSFRVSLLQWITVVGCFTPKFENEGLNYNFKWLDYSTGLFFTQSYGIIIRLGRHTLPMVESLSESLL